MNTLEIFNKLKTQFGEAIVEHKIPEKGDEFIIVAADKIFDIALELRDNPAFKFDYLTNLSGIDCGDKLCVVYHLFSMELKHSTVIKLFVPRDNPTLSTVERVWRSADWHEREAYDMFGFHFEGHHNLIRILCPYDWEGYPLRKDYKTPEEFHGMRIPY